MIFLVVVIGFIGYRNGEQEVARLAARNQEGISIQVRDYLHRFLQEPLQVIQLMAQAVESGRLDPTDRQAVIQTLWSLHRIFPDAAYLNYGWSSGDFIGLGQVDNTTKTPFLEMAPASSIDRLEQYQLDASGHPSVLKQIKPFADFRSDGWYALPSRAAAPVWIPIYNWVDAPEVMALGVGVPIKRSGVLVGVAEIDTFLANISLYLRQLPVAQSGVIYIVDADGYLVADSSSNLPFSIINGKARRHLAQQAENSLIRNSAQALIKSQGPLQSLGQSLQLDLPLVSGHSLVRVDPFRVGSGLDWHIVIVMSDADLFGNLRTEIARQLLVSLAAILISGVTTVVLVQYVTRQLDQLVISADAMAEGDLSQVVEIGSIQEISRIANSLNNMADRLRRSFATLRTRNREISRLADSRKTQLSFTEQQRDQEMLQRERLERSLADASRAANLSPLLDPQTGLFTSDGLQRRVRSLINQGSTVNEPLLALQLALDGDGDSALDALMLQKTADWLESLAADHQGLAASLGGGRFTLLLLRIEPPELIQRLEALTALVAPCQVSHGIAYRSQGTDPDSLLAEADLELRRSRG
jgi:HAMP domain-containing protein/GGDEF domain-containing protein